jgi:ribonuclease HII
VICGVDEAGKGSVLGPMVVAAVGVLSEDVFSGLPVRDSKLIRPRERERLSDLICSRCRVATVIIPAEKIDAHRLEASMNRCVARAHANVIRQIRPKIAYVDACDVDPERHAQVVVGYLGDSACRIISEHRADRTYPVVSAASIVAKVIRDSEIRSLARTYGEIGSGYPSDPVTIAFLSSYIGRHHNPPACARKSWKTVGAMLEKKEQSRLAEFR